MSIDEIKDQCDKLIEGPPPSWEQVYAAQRCARALLIAVSFLSDKRCSVMESIERDRIIAAIRKEFEP